MNILIVDDEALARSVSVKYLKQIDSSLRLFEASNAFEAKALIEKEKIDLIILDIEMPKQNGIEFLIENKVDSAVIFATAYNEFAIQAFELNAIDYLMKPYDFQRFKTAFLKAKEIGQSKLIELMSSIQSKMNSGDYLERLFIKEKQKIHILKSSDIIAIESLADYCKIITDKGQFLELKRLSDYEKQLNPKEFIRIHRSTIIRIDEMTEIDILSAHKSSVKMSSGKIYDVSESGLKRLKSFK